MLFMRYNRKLQLQSGHKKLRSVVFIYVIFAKTLFQKLLRNIE